MPTAKSGHLVDLTVNSGSNIVLSGISPLPIISGSGTNWKFKIPLLTVDSTLIVTVNGAPTVIDIPAATGRVLIDGIWKPSYKVVGPNSSTVADVSLNLSGSVAAVSLSGSGSLGANGKPTVSTTRAMSGSGTLNLSSGTSYSTSATLSGSGGLDVSGVANNFQPVVLALSGLGSLSAAFVPRPAVSKGFSGAGSLTNDDGTIGVAWTVFPDTAIYPNTTSYPGSGSAVTADTSYPTTPSNVTISNITTTGFTVSWTAATDNVGVTAYGVKIDDVTYATPTVTNVTVTGRTPGTAYAVRVQARDAAGNYSFLSNAVNVTTLADSSVLVSSNLDNATVSNPISVGDMRAFIGASYGGATNYQYTSVVSTSGPNGATKVLNQHLEAGTFGMPGGIGNGTGIALTGTPLAGGPVTEASIEFDIRFVGSGTWPLGGKIPGLGGMLSGQGSPPTGGEPSEYGWSGRSMFRRNSAAPTVSARWVGYLYEPTQASGSYGVDVVTGKLFLWNTWYHIKQYYKMNTVTTDNVTWSSNGIHRMWMDGVMCWEDTSQVFRVYKGTSISHLVWDNFAGGNDSTWGPPTDVEVQFDNLLITTP